MVGNRRFPVKTVDFFYEYSIMYIKDLCDPAALTEKGAYVNFQLLRGFPEKFMTPDYFPDPSS